jgi:hypothetical protein
MEERISSSRNNAYIRNTQDEARELLVRWAGGNEAVTGFHIKGEYPRALEQVVQNAIQTARRSRSRAFKATSMFVGDATTSAVKIRGARKISKNILKL